MGWYFQEEKPKEIVDVQAQDTSRKSNKNKRRARNKAQGGSSYMQVRHWDSVLFAGSVVSEGLHSTQCVQTLLGIQSAFHTSFYPVSPPLEYNLLSTPAFIQCRLP